MPKSKAVENRRIRQQALREQLASQGHVQHVIDIVGKLQNKDEEMDSLMLKRYEVVINTKLKLINKYLPELKATEITGEGGGPVQASVASLPAEVKETEFKNNLETVVDA